MVILGGEQISHLVLAAQGARLVNLLDGEILYLDYRRWLIHVSEISASQLVSRRPGGEHVCALLMLLQKLCGADVQLHKITVRQVVFRGNAVRRIKEERQDKEDDDNGGGPLPASDTPAQRRHADDDDQRVRGKQVTRQQRSTH